MKSSKEFKEKMHPRDKKILIIGGILCAMVVITGIGLRIYISNKVNATVPSPPQPVVASSKPKDYDITKYAIPKNDKPIELPKESDNDHVVETEDENGNYLKEQVIAKPEPPTSKPELADNTDLTDTTKTPEYKEGSTINKDPKPGDINDKGETWLGSSVGWVGEGSGGTGETIPMDELSGIQVGH